MTIDEAFRKHEIVTATQDADGKGWVVHLDCGHTIWCSVHPAKLMYCGECYNDYRKSVRGKPGNFDGR